MAKPNFFIIGAAKAGTTSLAYYLNLQPQIFFSNPKELNFFCDANLYPQKIDWYESHFQQVDEEIAIGEGSPPYASCETRQGTAKNINNYNPDAKIIYLVRHPLDRLKSHYLQLLNNGYCGRISLAQAIDEFPEILDSSLYWKQIEEYRKYFGDEKIQILFFEEFITNPGLIVEKCCRFLGVSFNPLPEQAYIAKNATKDHFEDRPFYQVLKKMLPINFTLKSMPKPVKTIGRRILRKPQMPAPEWDQNLLKKILSDLEDDLSRFYAYAGKPQNFYKLPEMSAALKT